MKKVFSILRNDKIISTPAVLLTAHFSHLQMQSEMHLLPAGSGHHTASLQHSGIELVSISAVQAAEPFFQLPTPALDNSVPKSSDLPTKKTVLDMKMVLIG